MFVQLHISDCFLCWQQHFTWEAPTFSVLYERSPFDWMENMSALDQLISSAGFTVKFTEITSWCIEPTEGNINVVS